MVKQLEDWLWVQINGPVAIWSWQEKHQMPPQIWDKIDWDALSLAYKELPIAKWSWASKWTLGHFSFGKNMVRWKFWSSAACPRCGKTPEDKDHVLLCGDPLDTGVGGKFKAVKGMAQIQNHLLANHWGNSPRTGPMVQPIHCTTQIYSQGVGGSRADWVEWHARWLDSMLLGSPTRTSVDCELLMQIQQKVDHGTD